MSSSDPLRLGGFHVRYSSRTARTRALWRSILAANLLNTPSDSYVATEFAARRFRLQQVRFGYPGNNTARRRTTETAVLAAITPDITCTLWLCCSATGVFATRCRLLLRPENIPTFDVLLGEKLPREPLHNRPHNRIAGLHITIHRHHLGPQSRLKAIRRLAQMHLGGPDRKRIIQIVIKQIEINVCALVHLVIHPRNTRCSGSRSLASPA
jgi:hypothetical protein